MRSAADSPKTLIAKAKREIPGFTEHFAKFEEQVTIGGYSSSTIFNYSRAVAKVSLHFGKSILDLDPDEVNEFLFHLAKEKKASSTYFKHTVYGLRFFFRLYDLEDRVLRLPTVKKDRKVPVLLKPAHFVPHENTTLQYHHFADAILLCPVFEKHGKE